MTVSPGATYTNDILGNRLTKGSATYGWDCLNRMVSHMNGSANETYGYRAEGMRTFKSNSGSTTVYRYDGQMLSRRRNPARRGNELGLPCESGGMEDVDIAGSTTDVTDYGLGARGIDYISYSVNGGTPSVSFPVYDAHGNMVATLARNGGGTYQVSNQRAYGAWGEIRQGATTGDPKGRYCANLGHKQDDESGLTYMRARYYDGVSGRFISEDPKRHSHNWVIYTRNNPVGGVDADGCVTIVDILTGAADETVSTFQEAQEGTVTYGWAENAIQSALTNWAKSIAPAIVDALYGDDLTLEKVRAGVNDFGIQLVGIADRWGLAIVTIGSNITIETYEWGAHAAANVETAIQDWW